MSHDCDILSYTRLRSCRFYYVVGIEIDTVFNFKLFFTKFPFFFASFSFGGSTPKPPRYLHKGDVT